uniref:Death domain containing 1 n=1 Tax=Scophthalmus maximus TaxID=52904 RepID=A0A8D3A5T7_SCOMX
TCVDSKIIHNIIDSFKTMKHVSSSCLKKQTIFSTRMGPAYECGHDSIFLPSFPLFTHTLTGEMEDSQTHVPDACFIRAPMGAAEALRCEMADSFSCLMVTGSEELVSRVIRVRVHGGANLHFPVTVVVPFCARYRGNYRDVAVKIVDGERRASYVTPTTTEGTYGGQRGSFAEVRVYSLGLFAVVSCLKRENYTVPRRGLSLKLPVDPRICLNYLPGAFTTPVMAQTTIQPVDTVLLAAVKSRRDVYRSVVSTSPLVHLAHPTSQPLRRPLTVTLPCPPNPEKKRDTRGRGRPAERRHIFHIGSPSVRILGASLKPPKETSNELLVVLGSREKQWRVLEKVPVRSQQKGLASFELTESLDRFNSPPMQLLLHLSCLFDVNSSTFLLLEHVLSIGRHAVTLVLQCRRDDPHAVLVAALPSRDLSWELGKLRAQGYGGLPQTSPDISMREGDQLLLCFTTGTLTSRDYIRLAFHSQRTNHLLVRLTEVDPFGNYSSPHYKGAAAFYKVTRGQLEWRGDTGVPKDSSELPGDPVCRLSLTLPKVKKRPGFPVGLSSPLAGRGTFGGGGGRALVRSLRVRRSAAQLVKLRAGDSPSTQAFHVLATWRRGLPAAPHQLRASRLARCLAKSGRPDLARELLLRQARTGLAEIGK